MPGLEVPAAGSHVVVLQVVEREAALRIATHQRAIHQGVNRALGRSEINTGGLPEKVQNGLRCSDVLGEDGEVEEALSDVLGKLPDGHLDGREHAPVLAV